MTLAAQERDEPARGATDAPSALSLRGVKRRMGRETVLAGIDLEVAAGRLVVLRGSNGSGKTTLLRLLATRLRPHAGTASLLAVPAHGDLRLRHPAERVGSDARRPRSVRGDLLNAGGAREEVMS